jgi:hypothetical protein
MRMRKRRGRVKRIVFWTAGGAFVTIVLGAALAWLAFQHIPSWYVPIAVPQAELSRIRNGLPNTYQDVNDRIIAGKPFEYALNDVLVTEWLVARAELYPDAREWLPNWVRDPVVRFQDGRGILGARIRGDGWETILGVYLVADITRDTVTVRLDGLTAGSLPVPVTWLADPLRQWLNDKRLDLETMPDPVAAVIQRLRDAGPTMLVDEGVTVRNLFQTRNGHRVFKLQSASTNDGNLIVGIQPL